MNAIHRGSVAGGTALAQRARSALAGKTGKKFVIFRTIAGGAAQCA
jgi:hypothetical protein